MVHSPTQAGLRYVIFVGSIICGAQALGVVCTSWIAAHKAAEGVVGVETDNPLKNQQSADATAGDKKDKKDEKDKKGKKGKKKKKSEAEGGEVDEPEGTSGKKEKKPKKDKKDKKGKKSKQVWSPVNSHRRHAWRV